MGVLQGQTDTPLNEAGEKQAEELQKTLAAVSFAAIFTSDLSRASKTAEIVCGSRQITIQKTKALRERCMMDWETHKIKDMNARIEQKGDPFAGLSKDEYLAYRLPLRNEPSAQQSSALAAATQTTQIESYGEVYERVSDFLKTQVTTHYLGKKVLVSTHGGLMRSLLYKLEDWHPGLFWSVPNCSYLVLRAYEDGTIQIMSKNASSPTEKSPELTTKTSTRW